MTKVLRPMDFRYSWPESLRTTRSRLSSSIQAPTLLSCRWYSKSCQPLESPYLLQFSEPPYRCKSSARLRLRVNSFCRRLKNKVLALRRNGIPSLTATLDRHCGEGCAWTGTGTTGSNNGCNGYFCLTCLPGFTNRFVCVLKGEGPFQEPQGGLVNTGKLQIEVRRGKEVVKSCSWCGLHMLGGFNCDHPL